MAQARRKHNQKAGRHSLLTAEITQTICSYITAGCYDYAAAEACGISLHTFKEWMARGEGRDERSQDQKIRHICHSDTARQGDRSNPRRSYGQEERSEMVARANVP